MPAVTDDLSVASSGSRLYPNPEQPVDAPVIINATPLPSEFPPFPLNHARILYKSILLDSSIDVSSGSNGENVLIPNTADRWVLTSSGSDRVTFTMPENRIIDTVSIGAHNISSIGATVEVLYDADDGGGGLISIGKKTPTENTALMFHASSGVSARRVQVSITNGSGGLFVGSVYAGVALQMQRPFFSGHTPINLSAVTDYFSSRTETGNFIGREIRSREFKTSAAWNNLGDNWYRTYFQPFVESAKTLPFYFAWNLDQHPNDVGYCMTSADIAPSYSGVRDLFSVSFDMIGVG